MKNHVYLYLLYQGCGGWWSSPSNTLPDLEEVTDFLKVIAATQGPQNTLSPNTPSE